MEDPDFIAQFDEISGMLEDNGGSSSSGRTLSSNVKEAPANPRGDLETLCRRDPRFGWPEFETTSVGTSQKVMWQTEGTMAIDSDGKVRIVKEQRRDAKKNKSVANAAEALLAEALRVRAVFKRNELLCENQIIADADGKLHPDRSYLIMELVDLEKQKFNALPDRSVNDARRELVEALGPIRFSYPFMMSQPGQNPDMDTKTFLFDD